MIVALYAAAQIMLLTNPPRPSPYYDTGRRFSSLEACAEAMRRSSLNGEIHECRVLRGMI